GDDGRAAEAVVRHGEDRCVGRPDDGAARRRAEAEPPHHRPDGAEAPARAACRAAQDPGRAIWPSPRPASATPSAATSIAHQKQGPWSLSVDDISWAGRRRWARRRFGPRVRALRPRGWTST